jgi:hypothetical protein
VEESTEKIAVACKHEFVKLESKSIKTTFKFESLFEYQKDALEVRLQCQKCETLKSDTQTRLVDYRYKAMPVELPKGDKQMIKCREGCADCRKVYEPFDKDAICGECHNSLIALLESSKSTRPHH